MQRNRRRSLRRWNESKDMDPKIAMLLMLIAAIIGLSHLNDDVLARAKQMFAPKRWRELVPVRRKS